MEPVVQAGTAPRRLRGRADVELTEEFSFAYIKELFLSTTMRWIAHPEPGGMEEAMVTQCAALREQMSSMNEEPLPEFEPDADPAAIQVAQAMMRRRLRGRRLWGA